MRITRIQLKVKNATNEPKTVNLLQSYELEPNHAANQPGVSVKVIVTTSESRYYEEYEKFASALKFQPIVIAVKHTSGNRQLNFFYQRPDNLKQHIVPNVDPKGNVLLNQSKSFEWVPSRWNIADSGCSHIFDHATIIECNLKPLQEFNIFLSVKPQPKIELTPAAPADEKNNPIKTYLHHFASPNNTIRADQKKPCVCKKALTYSKFTDCDGNCMY